MKQRLLSYTRAAFIVSASVIGLAFAGCTKRSIAQNSAANLQIDVKAPFHFVAYGDTRFHDPKDTDAANPPARQVLVKAVAEAKPAFICFTGDVVYKGDDGDDWKVFESETSIWREQQIPVYPVLGNHDLRGSEKAALSNYFGHFPELQKSRYYSVRAANTLVLALDSSLDETSGAQGQWLAEIVDHVPPDVDFVFIMDHHPPYTSSSDMHMLGGGGGHSARGKERDLAKMLEDRQAKAHFRIVMFSGHVHNYERHEHGGITSFVSGGGGAHAYPIERAASDPYQSKEINYHYLLVEVAQKQLQITMNRVQVIDGKAVWTKPDAVKIEVPAANKVQAAAH